MDQRMCYIIWHLKEKIGEEPILRIPNYSIKFNGYIDALGVAIDAILTQPGDDRMDYPNSYKSRKLNKDERNYSTTEREALKMVFTLQKYWHYLLANPFLFYRDNQEVKYLVNKPIHHGRICRWLLLFQEFES